MMWNVAKLVWANLIAHINVASLLSYLDALQVIFIVLH